MRQIKKMSGNHLFTWNWTLKDAAFTNDKGKVFSCFACGGGSAMGYKLAGFDVIGCNEIDKRVAKVYEMNLKPRFMFDEDIRTLKQRDDLPLELFNIDILDGSPPCSTFSMSGLRERAWGVERRFREGQAAQVLDTLFFDFIDLASKLRPKVVVAENVKGLLAGKAKKYVAMIYEEFDKAGYTCQHFLLNAAAMGVPQRRQRVFFLCLRKDLTHNLDCRVSFTQPYVDMEFDEDVIPYSEIALFDGRPLVPSSVTMEGWKHRERGDIGFDATFLRMEGKRKMWNHMYVYGDKVVPTIAAAHDCMVCFDKPLLMSPKEVARASTFPSDYDYGRLNPVFICGMSVPPVMMAQIATRVYKCWLSKINA